MPRREILVGLHALQKAAGRIEILDVLQHVGFRADQFVRFRQVCRASVPDDLPGDPRRQRVSRYAGKGVRSTALKRDLEARHGSRSPGCPIYIVQPSRYNGLGVIEIFFKSAPQRKEAVGEVAQVGVVLFHISAEHGIGERLRTVVDRKDGAHVRVHH